MRSRHSHSAIVRSCILGLALLMALFLLPHSSDAAPPAPAADKIEAQVLDGLAKSGQTTFWLILSSAEDLGKASRIRDWGERGRFVYNQLRSTADASQAGLIALLQARQTKYRAFWLVNAIQVTGGPVLLNELAARPEVIRIVADRVYHIPTPTPSAKRIRTEDIEWNIAHIRAPQVWATFGVRGEDIVVANIDGGVDFTHPALVAQYRGNLGGGIFDHNYNWFDPYHICGIQGSIPCDNDGHGTHTMGTMLGSEGESGPNQIGVAPRARWIAAKGCEGFSCSDESLLAAGQWILAPTDLNGQNPRAELRPHIVNNSWGGPSNDPFYRAVVQAWEAAGIFNTFAIGNDGEGGCRTAGSPGDYPESYGVGAFDRDNRIADFSSRGPSAVDENIKPNISAPGVDVRSSIPGGNYDAFDGTSMAAPHVAGVVALMWSAAPTLVGDIAATRALLDESAIDSEDLRCGGTPAKNNVWGEGRLDAFAAVERSPRGPTGTLQGTVTPGRATIQAVGPISRTIVTNESGAYAVRLPVGNYALTVSLFGHISQNAADVVINEGASTTRDFQLAAAPSHRLSGHTRDQNGQVIVNAAVRILNTPLPIVRTDTNGFYSFDSVPVGSYAVRAEAEGCNGTQTKNLILDSEQVLDFTLPEKTDAAGYTCQLIAPDYTEANTILNEDGDEEALPVELPFPFVFYGEFYNTAYICVNGYLSFNNDCLYGNRNIPSSYLPNAAIYAFWDDLVVYGGGSIRSEVLGARPNRRFIVEWRNVGFYEGSNEMRVDFEIVLFENGHIQTHYRNIGLLGREMGDSATLGIEDQDGAIALQYSFSTPAISSPNFALRYTPLPGAYVTGRVNSSNRGVGIAGATVRAILDGSETHRATTNGNGEYAMRLALGLYTLEASAPHYRTQTVQTPLKVADEFVIRDFSLESARIDISPPSIQLTMTHGEIRTELLTLRNLGSSDLVWKAREGIRNSSATGRSQPLWPGFQRQPTWSRSDLPPSLLSSLAPADLQASDAGSLEIIAQDPVGDAEYGADIVAVRGASDGISTLSLALEFSQTLPISSISGYLFLDTDQNPTTGDAPQSWYGLPGQTVGADYIVDLFSAPIIFVYRAETREYVAATIAHIDGQTLSFEIPLAALGDDGAMNVAGVVGDEYSPTDWVPDSGHGTLFPGADVAWLSISPVTGTLPAGGIQAIEVVFDGRSPEIGASADHLVALTLLSNDPVTPGVTLPITVQVAGSASGPKLRIAADATTHYSGSVTLPIAFAGSQYGISALDFALALPDTCLAFNPDDKDGNGIPDAVVFALTDAYSRTVTLADDAGGKRLIVQIADRSAPFASLADGKLLSVNFTATCQPPRGGQILVPLPLAAHPPLSFRDGGGKKVAGEGVDGSVRILWGRPGDGNGDGKVDNDDIAACTQEIFDGDGVFWLDAPGGAFPGSPVGADANQDTRIGAADVICTALISAGGPQTCLASPTHLRSPALGATVYISTGITVDLDQTVKIPIYFSANGNPVAATAFTLDFDKSWLGFDTADGNGNGVADSVAFALSESFAFSITHRAGEGRIGVFVGDIAPPVSLLPDGLIATLTFQARSMPANAQGRGSDLSPSIPTAIAVDGVQLTSAALSDDRKRETLLHFSQIPGVSSGSNSGQSLPVTAQDGSVLISLYEVFLPVAVR